MSKYSKKIITFSAGIVNLIIVILAG